MNRQRGSASVRATFVVLGLILGALIAGQVVAVLAAQRGLQSGADLAALAASRAALEGADGCAAARRAAEKNDLRIRRCRMDLAVATISASRRIRLAGLGTWMATTKARAAPVDYVSP